MLHKQLRKGFVLKLDEAKFHVVNFLFPENVKNHWISPCYVYVEMSGVSHEDVLAELNKPVSTVTHNEWCGF